MSHEGNKWKKLRFMVLFLLGAAIILLPGMVTAVKAAEVAGITRYAPIGPAPRAEFEVTLRISGDLPLVVGIVETIPQGFSFVSVSTTHSPDQYSVSGQKVAFAVINKTEIKYQVMAPSSGEGTFTGKWVDMLSDHEGTIAESIVIVGGGGAGSIEEITTPTPTPSTAPTVTRVSRNIPVMGAGEEVAMAFEDMDVSLITLKVDKNVSDVQVVVEKIEKLGIPEPPGIAYAYLDITVENEEGAKMEGKIECKVTKSWLLDNNIDEAKVTVNRYDSAEGWQVLATSKTGEDNNFAYFEAETPGFSTFAVTGKEKEKVETTSTPAVATTLTPTPRVPPTPSQVPPEVQSVRAHLPQLSLILAGVFALIAALVAFVFVFKKRGKGGIGK